MLDREAQWIAGLFTALEKSLHDKIDDAVRPSGSPIPSLPTDSHSLPSWEELMTGLESLIANGQKLMSERAAMKADLVAETARADKAEADLAAAKKQMDDDDAKATEAASELLVEIEAEDPAPKPDAAPAPVSVTVAAPTAAGATTIPVNPADAATASKLLGDAITAGSTVSVAGVGAQAGTTLEGVADGALELSHPTDADHVGDGSETLTITPAS